MGAIIGRVLSSLTIRKMMWNRKRMREFIHVKENMDTSNEEQKQEQQQQRKELNASNIKRPSAFMNINGGEASEDDDSSLLLDENHEDESSEDHHGKKQIFNSNSYDSHFNFN